MIRITDKKDKYEAVHKYNENRYRINFDKVAVIINEKDEEGKVKEGVEGVESDLATWSVQDYFKKPTTEQVQADVKSMTIQRYKNEGLEPPKEEEIDVTPYVID